MKSRSLPSASICVICGQYPSWRPASGTFDCAQKANRSERIVPRWRRSGWRDRRRPSFLAKVATNAPVKVDLERTSGRSREGTSQQPPHRRGLRSPGGTIRSLDYWIDRLATRLDRFCRFFRSRPGGRGWPPRGRRILRLPSERRRGPARFDGEGGRRPRGDRDGQPGRAAPPPRGRIERAINTRHAIVGAKVPRPGPIEQIVIFLERRPPDPVIRPALGRQDDGIGEPPSRPIRPGLQHPAHLVRK